MTKKQGHRDVTLRCDRHRGAAVRPGARGGVLAVSCFFSSRRRHTISVSAFLLNRSSDLGIPAEPLFRSMESALCRNEEVIVVGGGNGAGQIGRASCRGRGEISGVAVSLKKKKSGGGD